MKQHNSIFNTLVQFLIQETVEIYGNYFYLMGLSTFIFFGMIFEKLPGGFLSIFTKYHRFMS